MSNVRTVTRAASLQIVWPNGTVHRVGKFASAGDAAAWIAAHSHHSHLTTPAAGLTTPAAGRETAPEPLQPESA